MLKLYKNLSFLLLLIFPLAACQDSSTNSSGTNLTDEEGKASVEAKNQSTFNGNKVVVANVTTSEPVWLVIYRDSYGWPGSVLGHTLVKSKDSSDIQVQLKAGVSNNEQLWAKLHKDTGIEGEFEFSGTDSLELDGPLVVGEDPVKTSFAIEQTDPALTRVPDQINKGGVLEADVNAAEDGWVVLHRANDAGDAPAQVIGNQMVSAGTDSNVFIPLNDGESVSAGEKLFAMLHYDTGADGEFEFGGLDSLDQPVVFKGGIVSRDFTVIENQSRMTAEDQTVQNNSITVDVGADADGWVVVHRDADSAPAQVIGQAPITNGENNGVKIAFGESVVSDGEQLWPMVHYDTGTVGEYEFGGSDTPDQPMVVGESPLTKLITVSGAIPEVTTNDQDSSQTLSIAQVDADQIGWIVLHRDDNDSPGAVFGNAQVYTGENGDMKIMLGDDVSISSGEQVWAMLHIDNGTIHEYEFGQGDGNDPPVTDDLGNPIMDSFVVE